MTLNEKIAWLIKISKGRLQVQYPIDVCGKDEWFIGVPAELVAEPEVVARFPDKQAGFAMPTLEETVDYVLSEIREDIRG